MLCVELVDCVYIQSGTFVSLKKSNKNVQQPLYGAINVIEGR